MAKIKTRISNITNLVDCRRPIVKNILGLVYCEGYPKNLS